MAGYPRARSTQSAVVVPPGTHSPRTSRSPVPDMILPISCPWVKSWCARGTASPVRGSFPTPPRASRYGTVSGYFSPALIKSGATPVSLHHRTCNSGRGWAAGGGIGLEIQAGDPAGRDQFGVKVRSQERFFGCRAGAGDTGNGGDQGIPENDAKCRFFAGKWGHTGKERHEYSG